MSNNDPKAVQAFLFAPTAHSPRPPSDFTPFSRVGFRGITPFLSELAVIQGAVGEIQRFDDYAAVFGRTAPHAPVVAQAFDAASRWSSERRAAQAWLDYAATQEAICWKATRRLLDDLKAAFSLATSQDANLEAANPHLTRFFAVRHEMAMRSAATRARNKKAKAETGASEPVSV
jgi:hypothetical protein